MNTGFDYIRKQLDFSSPLGKKAFENIKIMNNKEEIEKSLQAIEVFNNIEEKNIEKIKQILSHIQDIEETIKKLNFEYTLDEIELFQIKVFSIFSQDLFKLLNILEIYNIFNLENIEEVIKILDPRGERLPTFYIYEEYDKNLKEIRKIKESENDESKLLEILSKEKEIEREICEQLSKKLHKFSNKLLKNFQIISFLDLSISKYELSKKINLKMPQINRSFEIIYEKLFNPEVENLLNERGKKFQKIDITLNPGTQIITGANMGGKTVLLRTIALSQMMFQMGFYVPAEFSKLPIFDEIFFVSGDFQNIKLGLSSFAAEMEIINNIYNEIKSGKKILILLDEPARTTNPTEGSAIVKTISNLFNKENVICVISTHFDNVIDKKMRHLRIKGLKDVEKIDTSKDIQDYFDYSIEEVQLYNPPKEALKILKILKIDNDIVSKVEEVLTDEKQIRS
ncbi:dsDNA-specific endonuclease/ATPase MutS2 [Thermosipho japonicus]|uniref:DsDNA-specific endonuclease/ATPase MutS2 n=1 Tax=Thermosipho japonicus TaxID=90323 RepID=A0A841GFN0_9BACT|nr:DNA mismatch repair protein MutS [Thermosipho japonicus]MBB6062436.1 dsDNA-specific endonuclease/ATPase MutS2 [Thermosipho japonicus]